MTWVPLNDSTRISGPLLALIVLLVCVLFPWTAAAAFPQQPGKTPSGPPRCAEWSTGGAISQTQVVLNLNEQQMRAARVNGHCEQSYTDGSHDTITFNYSRQTLSIQHFSAPNGFLGGSQPVGDPRVMPWEEAAQIGANQAAANAAANPNDQAAQAAATDAAAEVTAAQSQAAQAAASATACDLWNLDNCIQKFIYEMVKRIALFFLLVASTFLALVGLLFNWTVYITVFQFGNLIGNNEGMLAAWGVLRDLGNILLLFGFIFMGVSTILNLPGNEFTAKKALPSLIIFAILLNFSLFAAEAVIDVSNGLGSTFYKQAGQGLCPENVDATECATEHGIAGAILTMSGVTTVFDVNSAEQFPDTNNTFGMSIAIIGLTLFMATTAFVLLAAVFMFIARACTLAFLMVASPIGFAGMAVPILHKYAKMWWEQLLQQALFAPVYILMILISIKFMDGVRMALGVNDSQTLLDTFKSGAVSNLSMVVLFILLIGFLLMASQAAKSMSAVGAGASTKWAGALVFGGMARANNLAFGGGARAARMLIQKTPLKRVPGTRFLTNNVLRPLEGANIDFRRMPGYSNIQKVAGGPAEHASYTDMMHQKANVQSRMNESNRQFAQETAKSELHNDMMKIRARNAVNAGLRKLGKPELPPEKLSEGSQRFLMGLSGEQIAADHDLSHAMHELAGKLSADQFEAYMRSDKVSETDKGHARDARYGELRQQIAAGDGSKIRKWSGKDLEQFLASPAFVTMKNAEDQKAYEEFITQMSDDQFDGLNKSSRVTNDDKTKMQDMRGLGGRFSNAPIEETDPADPTKTRVVMRENPVTKEEEVLTKRRKTLDGMSSDKKAKLDESIIMGGGDYDGAAPDQEEREKRVYAEFKMSDFEAIRKAGKLSEDQRKEIGAHVTTVLGDKKHSRNKSFLAYQKTFAGTNNWKEFVDFYGLPEEFLEKKEEPTESGKAPKQDQDAEERRKRWGNNMNYNRRPGPQK